jgi:hypothetical protein
MIIVLNHFSEITFSSNPFLFSGIDAVPEIITLIISS